MMKPKPYMKKLLAGCLVLALLLGLSQPIWADTGVQPPESSSVTPSESTASAPDSSGDTGLDNGAQEDGAPANSPSSGDGTNAPEVPVDPGPDASGEDGPPQDAPGFIAESDALPEGIRIMMVNMGSLVEGVDYELVYLDAEQTLADENSVIVLTNAGLVEALTNTTPFRNIYLGADILSDSDLVVNPSKAGARLVGQRPEGGTTYTYTQMNNATIIRLSSITGGASFTFESINLMGLNYWGIAYGGGVANHIVFKNITYEGPQMLHASGSTVTLQDCTIHLVSRSLNGKPSDQAQELFEIGNGCEVLGTVTVHSESTVEEVFDLSGTPTFTVRAGGTLNVTAQNRLFIGGLNLVLEAGANITATTTSYPFGGTLTGFTMNSGAVFDLTCGSGTYSLLPVSTTLNVNDASRLSLNLASGSGGYGINYAGSAAATLNARTIYVNSYNAALYSTNAASVMNIAAGSCTFSSAAQYGIWFAASSLNVNAGTFLVNSASTGYAGIYSTKPVAITATSSMTVTTGGTHAINTSAAFALQSCGTVTLKPKSNGAGIYNTAGGVTIADCTALDITTAGSGAGIYAAAGLTVNNCGSLAVTATGTGVGINPTGNATFTSVGLAVHTGTGVGFSSATANLQFTFTGGSAAFDTGGSCFGISGSGATLAFDSLPVTLASGGSCIDLSAVGSAAVRFTRCPAVSLTAVGDGVKMSGNGPASLTFDRLDRLEIAAEGICVNATNNTKTISFINPGRAILSAGGAGVVGVYGTTAAYATKVNITTGALNRWNMRDIGTTPANIWNLASGGAMVISGSSVSSSGVFTIDTAQSTLPAMGTDPITEALNTAALNLTGTKLAVFGELALTVDTVYDLSPAITGSTVGDAAVSAAFTDGTAAEVSGSAAGDGAYSMDILAYEPDIGTTVTVTARHDQLSVRRQTVVQDSSAFALSIEVPETITYGTVAVSTQEQWVSLADDLVITVKDTRLRRGAWALQVQVNSAFTAVVGATTYELTGQMALVQENAEPVYLGQTLQTIYTRSENFDDEVTIDLSEVLKLYLPAGDGMGQTVFTVDIHWVLVEV